MLGRAVIATALLTLAAAAPAAAQRYRPAPDAAPAAIADRAPAGLPEEYRLGAGDQLAITYPYNPELNVEGAVGPDGRLTLPLAGTVFVADATVPEAAARIAAALRRANIVEDARPSIAVRTYAASVYVGGEVRTPGAVRLAGPMDAMRAVILAGGTLDTARSRKIVVIRQIPGAAPQLRYVDLRAYVKSGGAGQDASLRAQDVVFVPRSSVAEADLWIDQHINRLLPFGRSLNYNVGDVARTVAVP